MGGESEREVREGGGGRFAGGRRSAGAPRWRASPFCVAAPVLAVEQNERPDPRRRAGALRTPPHTPRALPPTHIAPLLPSTGAFPEVRVAQFPLDMGRPGAGPTGRTLALAVGADGKPDVAGTYARAGAPPGRTVAVGHGALVPKLGRLGEAAPRPDAEEEEATVAATRAALDAVVAGKVAATQPKALPKAPGAATYIKYTPAGGDAATARPGAVGGRIIKMQDLPVDPLAPPKFRHTKVPRPVGSPPAPVLHSPEKAASAEERAGWVVPPCVSNWKNAKGFTIPLDKRLAADGRGLQEVAINDGFAKFAEALYVAEQTARQAVEMRARVAREVAAQETDRQEAALRELAAAARRERAGLVDGDGEDVAPRDEAGVSELPPPPPPPPPRGGDVDDRRDRRDRRRSASPGRRSRSRSPRRHDDRDHDDDADRARRDALRAERRRERERDRRADAAGSKRSKTARDADRDVSERVALGQAAVGGAARGGGGEALYDQRLFNLGAGGGVGSGLAVDDSYNLYDKPLFADRGSSMYRPRREGGEGAGGERAFRPDVGFAGAADAAAGGDAAASAGQPGGPVQFERAAEADPFGLDDFIGSVSAKDKGK